MAFQIPEVPNLTVQQQPMPDMLQKYGQMMSLKNMASEQSLRQQLAPLDVQEAQERAKQAGLQTELTQNQVNSQKAMMTAVASGALNKYAGSDAAPDGTGFDAPGAYADLVTNHGVLPEHASQLVNTFQTIAKNNSEIRKNVSEAQQKTLDVRAASHEQMAEDIAGILKLPPEQQPQALANKQREYLAHPLPGVDRADLAHFNQVDISHLPALAGILDLNDRIEAAQAKASSAETTALKGQLETAAPSTAQLQNFTTKTIPSFGSLRPEQKTAFITEAQSARTVNELNQIIERADSTDKAEQMHADSMAQTATLKGQAFGQKGLEANDKTWTDPQHGYLQTLSQANLGKAAIKAGADGNGLLTSLEPTMAVLGMNSFAGVHRISPAEAQAAGAPGGWAERFTAWASKAATGKLSDQLAKEGNQLFDQIIDSKYQASLQTSQMHAKGYNIPPQNMPAMDREGNVTTLDKVAKGGANANNSIQVQIPGHPPGTIPKTALAQFQKDHPDAKVLQ
jgi:hypothetical protein